MSFLSPRSSEPDARQRTAFESRQGRQAKRQNGQKWPPAAKEEQETAFLAGAGCGKFPVRTGQKRPFAPIPPDQPDFAPGSDRGTGVRRILSALGNAFHATLSPSKTLSKSGHAARRFISLLQARRAGKRSACLRRDARLNPPRAFLLVATTKTPRRPKEERSPQHLPPPWRKAGTTVTITLEETVFPCWGRMAVTAKIPGDFFADSLTR
jgi:hypothetical protein